MTHCIPREALAWHIAVLAKTGAGKSYAIRGDVVEPLLDTSERVCIVDPTDAWHGLRSSATGKSGGYPVVIFGGEHGDLPLGANHGEAIAEIVGTSSTSCILVTKHLSIRERTKFFTDFAEAIMRKNRGPLHLIIDEAHRFAPKGQKMSPQSGEMLAAANELLSAGRSAGLRVTLITQRPAKLHNDSLCSVETLVVLRMVGPADRKAMLEWVKDNADESQAKEILQSMASLKTGEGYVWCPLLDYLKRVKFPKIRTFDSGAAPESGAAGRGQVLAPIDRDAIAERLTAIGADVVANDPAALRRRIAYLEEALRIAEKTVPAFDQAHREQVWEEARAEVFREMLPLQQRHAESVSQLAAQLDDMATTFCSRSRELTKLTNEVADTIKRDVPPRAIQMPAITTLRRPAAPGSSARQAGNGKQSPSARKILEAIHKAYPVGLSFDSAARRAGISKSSSAYEKYLREVIAAHETESDVSRGAAIFTSKPQFAKSEPIKPGASVDQWAAKLPPSYGRMLIAIRDRGPNVRRSEIGEAAGVSLNSSGLGTGLRELLRLQLIVEKGELYTLAEGT